MRYGSYEASRVGSCATGSREPSQVRKEAALSGPSRVPQGRLIRANDEYGLMALVSTAGARSQYLARSLLGGIPASRAFAPDVCVARFGAGYAAPRLARSWRALGSLPTIRSLTARRDTRLAGVRS